MLGDDVLGEKLRSLESLAAVDALPGSPLGHFLHFDPLLLADQFVSRFLDFFSQLPHPIGRLNPLLNQNLSRVLHFLEDCWELWHFFIISFHPQEAQPQLQTEAPLIRKVGGSVVVVSVDPSQVQQESVQLFAEGRELGGQEDVPLNSALLVEPCSKPLDDISVGLDAAEGILLENFDSLLFGSRMPKDQELILDGEPIHGLLGLPQALFVLKGDPAVSCEGNLLDRL